MAALKITRWLLAVLVGGTCVAAGLSAQSGPVEYESFYYNDEIYTALSPGAHSANPNQVTFECFSLGPDLNEKPGLETIPMYVVIWPGGHHRCPAGGFEHDHVATAIPGSEGYTPHVRAVFVIPLDPSVLPLTSAAAIEAAEAAGQVLVIDTGIVFNAPVVRRAAS
jgi:hypothetical protein